MKFGGGSHTLGEVVTATKRGTDYILGKLYLGQGSRIRQKIPIDVKPVLPRSEFSQYIQAASPSVKRW